MGEVEPSPKARKLLTPRVILHPHRIHRRPLARYVSLIFYKAYADLRAESERTYAGFIWWVIEPIASMAVYYLVFGVIMQRGIPNYVEFLFVGLVPWRWLQTALLHGANSILAERSLMQQVYLPKIVFPLVTLLADTFKFLVVFCLLLIFLWISGFPPHIHYLAVPLVLLVQLLFISGLAILFAGIAPLLPDIRIVLENVVRLWFFLSGIFYAVDRFSTTAAQYLRLNPMVVVIESYRDIMLEAAWPDLGALGLVGMLGVVICILGIGVVRRYEYNYPKLRF